MFILLHNIYLLKNSFLTSLQPDINGLNEASHITKNSILLFRSRSSSLLTGKNVYNISFIMRLRKEKKSGVLFYNFFNKNILKLNNKLASDLAN